MRKILLCLMGFMVNNLAIAQTESDLEILVSQPMDGQVFVPGDTVRFSIKIVNHGPDDVLTPNDTIFVGIDSNPVSSIFLDTILANDTTESLPLFWFVNGGSEEEELSFCAFLKKIDTDLIDANKFNDTVCVSITLKDSGSVNIPGVSLSSYGQYTFYPNPTNSIIRIKRRSNVSNKMEQAIRIRVLNLFGRCIINQKEVAGDPFVVDIESLNNGTYIVEVIENRGIVSRMKIVKY